VIIYTIIYSLNKKSYVVSYQSLNQSNNADLMTNDRLLIIKRLLLYIFAILAFISLILTVSRSAWLGVGVASIFFAILILFRDRKIFWKTIIPIFLSGIASLAIVYVFHLTNFQLFNRVQSTASGLQKITIACSSEINSNFTINNVSELEKYGCRHINLEDIDQERGAGYKIREIYRTDPNVNIRAEIYKKSWQQIKMHPIMGIGWGNIGPILGTDDRGATLNSSNIFLEIWLGSGIIGLIAFLSVWVYILLKSVYGFFKTKDDLIKVFSLFLAISWLGLTVSNLFNAGIMMGFLWVWIAIALIDYKTE
jgi:O-antigen ligase